MTITEKLKECKRSRWTLDKTCNICEDAKAAVDVPTIYGPWAHLCASCANTHGRGQWWKVGTKIMDVE